MIHSLSKQIVKPRDCVLAFGIPTTRTAFDRALNDPGNRDFIVNRSRDWKKYECEVISEIENTEPNIRALGVRVVHDLTIDLLGQLFEDRAATVIVLFCHSHDASLEFDDGLASVPDVMARIPTDVQVIIDLCACRAWTLAKTIIKERPRCLTNFVESQATPAYWLYFYWALFKSMKDSELNYLEAFEATSELFFAP
jgi:hypothetical protein